MVEVFLRELFGVRRLWLGDGDCGTYGTINDSGHGETGLEMER